MEMEGKFRFRVSIFKILRKDKAEESAVCDT
jgi:hypothetical protein